MKKLLVVVTVLFVLSCAYSVQAGAGCHDSNSPKAACPKDKAKCDVKDKAKCEKAGKECPKNAKAACGKDKKGCDNGKKVGCKKADPNAPTAKK